MFKIHARKFARQCRICLLTIALPAAAVAQDADLEACFLKLIEARKQISGNTPPELSAMSEWSKCVVGKSIPKLNFETIRGKTYDDLQLRGKVLVINFWFKSCAPCVAEMPSLNKLYDEFKDKNVVFIGFATDDAELLKAGYQNSNKFLFEIVPSSGNMLRQFHFSAFPTTYIVDQKGKIVSAWSGYSPLMPEPYDRAKPIIQQLLSKK